jgi:hypothetical protein
MTYNEFYHLQIGDVVEIHFGDSFSAYVVIIINKKLSMESSRVIECIYYCKTIHPSKFLNLTGWYDDTSLVLCMDDRNTKGTFCYGYVDMDWQIGYARCRNLNDLNIFKGDI